MSTLVLSQAASALVLRKAILQKELLEAQIRRMQDELSPSSESTGVASAAEASRVEIELEIAQLDEIVKDIESRLLEL